MTVKAEVDRVSYALVPVHFKVRTVTPDISRMKFSMTFFKVVVSDDLKKGDQIYDFTVDSPNARENVVYSISGTNQYFSIHEYLGTLTLKQNFSELNLPKKSSKKFEFTVVARLRENRVILDSAIIHVIVIPAFSGDIFDHLVEKKPTLGKTIDLRNNRKTLGREFVFHRFFRQLSPTAQNISKAEMKFDKIIKGLRESVVDEFTGKNILNHFLWHNPFKTSVIRLFFVRRSKTSKWKSSYYKALSNIISIT